MNIHLQRGSLLFQQGRYEEAIGELHMQLAQSPEDCQTHALLALALAGLERLPEATQHAERAIHVSPDESLGHYALSYVLRERNRFAEAQRAIEEAIRLAPFDADYHGTLAGLHLDQQRWQAALEAADEGLAIEPEHNLCINMRSQALVKLGNRAAAAETMDQALARRPDDPLSHANQGWTLLHQGKPQPAMEHFREALRLDPTMEWARAGIVEAMKARHFVYRWLLAYFLWMARLSPGARWAFVIGGLLGSRVLRNVGTQIPVLFPLVAVVQCVYFAFVLMTWLAPSLFNLLLRLNRFGRHALSADQIRGANLLLACLVTTCAFLIGSIATGRVDVLLFALICALLTLPASAIFSCHAGWPRNTMVAITAGLAAATAVAAVTLLVIPHWVMHPWFPIRIIPPLFGFVGSMMRFLPWAMLGSQLAANYLTSVTPKK